MMLIVCIPCEQALRVNGNPDEAYALIGRDILCFKCQGRAERLLETEVEGQVLARLSIIDVNAEEALAAINGLGLPTERSCTKEDVCELFAQQRVKKVHARNIEGTPRCIVDHIELEDGTKVYLDSSTLGATVYRITRPISYVQRFEEANNG